MAIERNSLSGLRQDLSDALTGTLDENQRNQLRQAFSGAGIKDEYEAAFDNFGVEEALAQAAENGDLGNVYASVYDQDPSLRDALAEAASGAFSDSHRESIANHANQINLDAAYRACAKGDADAAAAAANISGSFNPSSTRECNNLVAEATGYSEGLHNAYKDEDDQSSYEHPDPPSS